MMQIRNKPYRFAVVFGVLLTAAFVFVLLDTFVIPKPMKKVVVNHVTKSQDIQKNQSKAVITDTSYEDKNIRINVEILRKFNTTVYIANIRLSEPSYLKTAFARNTYGRNINEKISGIAKNHNGILAINGDFYGFRDVGYVLRNGESYRDTARKSGNDEALVISKKGDFSVIQESRVHMDDLKKEKIAQIFCFGPALIKNKKITVDKDSEVVIVPYISGKPKAPLRGKPAPGMKKLPDMKSNPRTAIGQVSPTHYVFIVADGRTANNAGLSLLNLAKLFEEKECTFAYNFDGGGSSTMYFNGKVINSPTDGRVAGERGVSDIVYIGY